MIRVIGIDSRRFFRKVKKKSGEEGSFESVLGIAIRVKDYETFDKAYQEAIKSAFSSNNIERDFRYYCTNDLKNIENKWNVLESFLAKIEPHIEKIHVFYTLFSEKRLKKVKVYGRLAKEKHIKLANPTRTYRQLLSEHLVNCFPGICAWRLMRYLSPEGIQFHLDSYEGHICEAQEELDRSNFTRFTYPSGDCINPVISTADLLIALLDHRLEEKNLPLLFENLRLIMPEFKERLLAYPILNKHLPKITPIDKIPVDNLSNLKRPIYWVFKGEELLSADELKRSRTYRNLLDYVGYHGGCVKLFSKSKDCETIKGGDYGVYLNPKGLELIKSYAKIGRKLIPLNLDLCVKKEDL
jgi:hypothetical protein